MSLVCTQFIELRRVRILGSSGSRDMQMGADVQNEKTTASLTVCARAAARLAQRGRLERHGKAPGFG
jgi:hypothetical protein